MKPSGPSRRVVPPIAEEDPDPGPPIFRGRPAAPPTPSILPDFSRPKASWNRPTHSTVSLPKTPSAPSFGNALAFQSSRHCWNRFTAGFFMLLDRTISSSFTSVASELALSGPPPGTVRQSTSTAAGPLSSWKCIRSGLSQCPPHDHTRAPALLRMASAAATWSGPIFPAKGSPSEKGFSLGSMSTAIPAECSEGLSVPSMSLQLYAQRESGL